LNSSFTLPATSHVVFMVMFLPTIVALPAVSTPSRSPVIPSRSTCTGHFWPSGSATLLPTFTPRRTQVTPSPVTSIFRSLSGPLTVALSVGLNV